MQFLLVLSVIMVAVLGLLSALAVTMGSRRTQKSTVIIYDVIALAISAWSGVAVGLYLNKLVTEWMLVGPIVAGLGLVGFYYAILRHRVILLDAKWLRFLSYVVIMSISAIVYMAIFYFIFIYIFKFEDLSEMILVLNYVMVVVVLILFPVVNEVTNFINKIIRHGQVDLTFIVKKLNRMATEDVDLDYLAKFLARNLHFSYIGFIVGGKLYGSKALMVKKTALKPLTDLGDPEYGIWQDLDGTASMLCEELGIKAVAELRDAKGKSFGQILVGRPLGKMGFERKDLIQIETIVNLVAAMIDTRAKKVKR